MDGWTGGGCLVQVAGLYSLEAPESDVSNVMVTSIFRSFNKRYHSGLFTCFVSIPPAVYSFPNILVSLNLNSCTTVLKCLEIIDSAVRPMVTTF